MAERAAHLVDHVVPDVPVRQWVLSLPYRLRYRLAWDHDLCCAVVAVFLSVVLGWLRSPVTQERFHLTADGQVRLELRQPWRDGTTDVVFDPVEFLARPAVLVPRPRINLILYYGVLGPRAARRPALVRRQTAVARAA